MKRILVISIAPLALALGGCVTDGYYGGDIAYGTAYPYGGWYDGFYGPIYDGYWGGDGYFYYRGHESDRRYYRGDHGHFSRGAQAPAGGNWNAMNGSMQPRRGTDMPNFPRGGRHGH